LTKSRKFISSGCRGLFSATSFLAGLLFFTSSALIFELLIVIVTDGTAVLKKLIETSLKRGLSHIFQKYASLIEQIFGTFIGEK